ncbi:NifB/NifX family molybdenum-iron cluster-binding protein [Clostridium sp. WILCCON 0269]|uniref:NifB/NifX family molybdenum-iron cluster-binding protein n=1 Tax=Candidatus Clostridium eludens TaxID=3381663 RepID=A0ABW8SDJ1_9CLOT
MFNLRVLNTLKQERRYVKFQARYFKNLDMISILNKEMVLMGYNIAVASTDGVNIDKHFGASNSFFIIKVNDDETYENLGERLVEKNQKNNGSCSSCSSEHSCGHVNPKNQKKIETISDCRCLLCSRCGPGSEKQLGRNNISVFGINMKLDEALKTIIRYYKRSDERKSLKRIKKQKINSF